MLYRVFLMFGLLGFSYITVLYRVFLMFGLLGFSYIMVLYRVFLMFSFVVPARGVCRHCQ